MSQSRLQATVARVEAVLDLRTTIDTVERAISENQLEIAARNTHRILHEQQHEHNEASFGILTALEAKVAAVGLWGREAVRLCGCVVVWLCGCGVVGLWGCVDV